MSFRWTTTSVRPCARRLTTLKRNKKTWNSSEDFSPQLLYVENVYRTAIIDLREKTVQIRGRLSIFTKNHSSSVDENGKTLKTVRHPRLKARKRWKLAFRRGGKSKTDKFCVSAVADERKTVKLSFPSWGKSKIGENRISLTGKTKNQRKILSQGWEDGKMWKIGFPKLGKNKKRKKMAVPTLGRLKNSENWLSRTGENKKSAKIDFPPWGKIKKCRKLFVARKRNAENAKNSVSLASDRRKTMKTACRRPTKCRKCEKSFRYGSKSSIFWKICPNTIVNCQFSEKTAQTETSAKPTALSIFTYTLLEEWIFLTKRCRWRLFLSR